MTQEQIEQAAIDWRERSESAYTTDAFKAGAIWSQGQIIRKALFAYCKLCGVRENIALPNDCRKDCLRFEAFRKEMLNENKE